MFLRIGGHLLEGQVSLHSLSPVQSMVKLEKRLLSEARIVCTKETPASGSLCGPFHTLDQLQGESFYWNVARPDLSSGKGQAGIGFFFFFFLYTVLLKGGNAHGARLYTPAHTALQSIVTQGWMQILMGSQKGVTLLYPSTCKLKSP